MQLYIWVTGYNTHLIASQIITFCFFFFAKLDRRKEKSGVGVKITRGRNRNKFKILKLQGVYKCFNERKSKNFFECYCEKWLPLPVSTHPHVN